MNAFNFAPFNRRPARPTGAGYKDVNDRSDDGLDQDADGAARDMAKFIKDAYREAGGDEPADADKSDQAAKALAKATTYEERVSASAALIRSFT
jgi:hypothetical protein